MVQEVASEEVTLKGQKSEPIGEGVISTPAKVFLRIPDKVVFDITIPHALDLYEAANGAPPKSHEEFMKQVIDANQIQLPELPPESRYVYNPETKELLVEHPR